MCLLYWVASATANPEIAYSLPQNPAALGVIHSHTSQQGVSLCPKINTAILSGNLGNESEEQRKKISWMLLCRQVMGMEASPVGPYSLTPLSWGRGCFQSPEGSATWRTTVQLPPQPGSRAVFPRIDSTGPVHLPGPETITGLAAAVSSLLGAQFPEN